MKKLFILTVFVLICFVLSETQLNGFAPMEIAKSTSASSTSAPKTEATATLKVEEKVQSKPVEVATTVKEVKKEELKTESKPVENKPQATWTKDPTSFGTTAATVKEEEETGSVTLEDPLKFAFTSYFPLDSISGVKTTEADHNLESTETAEDYEHTLTASLNYENSLQVDSPDVVLGDSYEPATAQDHKQFLSVHKDTVVLQGKALKTNIEDIIE
jgi:hypothetical protein